MGKSQSIPSRKTILLPYFALTYCLLLINAFPYLFKNEYTTLSAALFLVIVYLVYCFIYLLPFAALILLITALIDRKNTISWLSRLHINPGTVIALFAISIMAALQTLLFADGFIFRRFGFHLNGFVWNLITTKGGIESMGGDNVTSITFGAFILGIVLIQAAPFVLLTAFDRFRAAALATLTKKRCLTFCACIVLLAIVQMFMFGFSAFCNYSPVLRAAGQFPFYMQVTFNSLMKNFGLEPPRDYAVKFKADALGLNYPLKPINQASNHKNLNIVWLVGESLRADMLDPNIMPQTWAFAQKSNVFKKHYSGGNGTRMGLFAMFYGLYGSYWFDFLHDLRGPVLIDLLIKNNYQMQMFTSAKFSYPEFDKTVFARIPTQSLHEEPNGASWQRDRANVTDLLKFVEHRDPNRPFMTFMFFESPHAKYDFPPEDIIRKPYLESFNYATVNLEHDIGLVKNRYINSCHHLDSQYGRVISYLEKNGLLDSTIVILTGDHGEEFMEHGYWGHNSSYVDQQILAPLVLWAPGQQPRQVTRMTSHLDLPPTILKLLGVTNPPQDYSLGFDLLSDEKRDFTIVSDWDAFAYIDHENKAIFPLGVGALTRATVTTIADTPLADKTAFYTSHRPLFMQVMTELKRFRR